MREYYLQSMNSWPPRTYEDQSGMFLSFRARHQVLVFDIVYGLNTCRWRCPGRQRNIRKIAFLTESSFLLGNALTDFMATVHRLLNYDHFVFPALRFKCLHLTVFLRFTCRNLYIEKYDKISNLLLWCNKLIVFKHFFSIFFENEMNGKNS